MVFVDTPLPEGFDLKPIRKVVGRPYGPDNPAKGRPKGTRDKVVRGLREGILVAAENIGSDGNGTDGLVGFLEDLGRYHKKAFTSLLVKLLPMEPTIRGDGVVRPGVNINIMSVESGSYLAPETIERLRAGQAVEQVLIEQVKPEPYAAPEPEPEPAPSLTALESRLLELSHDELLKLAEALNVGRGS